MTPGGSIGAGFGFLTLGFVFAFIGFAGWQDPENFAVMNAWLMREADSDDRRVYGRLVAGFVGCGGVAGMLFGLYLVLGPVLQ